MKSILREMSKGENLTTFREDLGEGRELHHSTSAEELIQIDEATLEQVAWLGELYEKGDIDPTYREGMAISIGSQHPAGRQHQLGNLPKPTAWDSREPCIVLFPVLDAFCKFLDKHRGMMFRGVEPYYVRATGFGAESSKETNLHCDIEREWYQFEGRRCLRSRASPESGRLVLGLDTKLRDYIPANLLIASGDFTVDNVVVEPEGVRTLEALDAFRPQGTLVTSDTHNIIEIHDPSFTLDPSNIIQPPNGVLLKQGCSTLHAGTNINDAMRVGLQCWY